AVAHASATAALVLSLHPDWTPAQVREALVKSATDLGPAGRDDEYGFGELNAEAAVNYELAPPAPPAPAPSTPAPTTPAQGATSPSPGSSGSGSTPTPSTPAPSKPAPDAPASPAPKPPVSGKPTPE